MKNHSFVLVSEEERWHLLHAYRLLDRGRLQAQRLPCVQSMCHRFHNDTRHLYNKSRFEHMGRAMHSPVEPPVACSYIEMGLGVLTRDCQSPRQFRVAPPQTI